MELQEEAQEQKMIFARCTTGLDKLNISPSGEVFPCEAFKWLGGQNLRPSIFEVPLAFIWENDPLLRLLREAPVPQARLEIGCEKAEACRGGCKGQAAQYWIREELFEDGARAAMFWWDLILALEGRNDAPRRMRLVRGAAVFPPRQGLGSPHWRVVQFVLRRLRLEGHAVSDFDALSELRCGS